MISLPVLLVLKKEINVNNAYSDVWSEGKCKLYVNGLLVILSDVLYVPNVRRNLVLVFVLDKKGFKAGMKLGVVNIIKSLNNDKNGEYEAFNEFCKGEGINHVYTMPYKP